MCHVLHLVNYNKDNIVYYIVLLSLYTSHYVININPVHVFITFTDLALFFNIFYAHFILFFVQIDLQPKLMTSYALWCGNLE